MVTRFITLLLAQRLLFHVTQAADIKDSLSHKSAVVAKVLYVKFHLTSRLISYSCEEEAGETRR